ncbi:MAG TPA: undecaprenyl-diphosphate phosphatase [Candidatus Woesebacteria bacterium]|nr:undecaprenyl-diphosphate phosphatase [Candidatus Woesebacteria bacterium]
MTYFQTIILAIIEGLTEFLPISSTGHLILAEKFLNIAPSEFTKSFNIIIQLSAILAVVVLYWKKIFLSRSLWKPIIFAFIPTGILGATLYKIVKGFLLDNVSITCAALFLGGIALLIVDRLPKLKSGSKKISQLKIGNSFSIGLFQSLSMIPGVSRSAASIVGGLANGLSRTEAVEFSFLLAIPTMAAASGYDLLKTGILFSSHEYLILLIGSLFSFLSAMLAVKAFTSFVSKHSFSIFAIYRLILAIVVWVVLLT